MRVRVLNLPPALTLGILASLICWPTSAAEPADDEAQVRVVRDVAYLGETRAEKLDLYLPVGGDSPRAAILIVHGGGWQGGDKAAAREQNIGHSLAAAGFVCASVNYRLARPTDHLAGRLREAWPQNLHDCQTAVRFLREHASDYQIAPGRIGAIGGSAGGHLVAMLAVIDKTSGLDGEGLYAEHSPRIQAVVPMYGVHDVVAQARIRGNVLSKSDEELCRQASPLTYVSPGDPPALILHGTDDQLVPTDQSTLLHSHLREAEVPSELLLIDGAPHSFHLQPKQRDLRQLVIQFFDRHLRRPE